MTVRVKGLVVAIGVSVRVTHVEGERVTVTERVRVTDTVRVKGLVLGIGVRVTVIEVDRVDC